MCQTKKGYALRVSFFRSMGYVCEGKAFFILKLNYLQSCAIIKPRKAVAIMARHRAITSKSRKRTMDKKRKRTVIIVDGIYVLLQMTGILIVGINQLNPLFVGCGLIIMGGISIPVAFFHVYITKKGWPRSSIYTNDNPEVKIAISIELIFLIGWSVVLPVLGVLRLLGLL